MAAPTRDVQDAIRAALGIDATGAAQPQADLGPAILVREWAEDVGLVRGRTAAGTASDIFWVFEDWCRRTYPAQPPPDHWAFAIELRRAGHVQKARLNGRWWAYLYAAPCADKLIRLRDELGPRPPLNWQLNAMPREYRGTTTRPEEFQDHEYRSRKERERKARRARRAGLHSRARNAFREALAKGRIVRPG